MSRHPGTVLLILVSYVPLLLTKPGMVGADTKTYLYLDPGRLLSRAPFMWDPNIGLGTVTHQNIGYLWPMGPYYFVMDAIGLPDWIAQRLWTGSILLAAGLGVRWMLKELRWASGGVTVASFAYALSPYVLEYAARISVILLPFAGLPWLIGLSARSLRRRDWRDPAIFALVALTVGGVNATSLILVMVGPILWFVYATFVLREVTFTQAIAAGLRITLLTFITSLWWIAGLMIQGRYGIPILRYTESYKTVAQASVATELYRGLGYWFFYGKDGLGAWTESSIAYVQNRILVAISFMVPGLAFLSGVVTRWRTRIYFALLIVAGLVIGAGAHPWDAPSPYGALFKAWTRSDLGLSFRSTPRSAPLIVLGLAVFLGAGIAAVGEWRPERRRVVAAAGLVLVLANMVPLYRGQFVDRHLMRDENVPDYWIDAAAALNDGPTDTRAFEVPGIDFAAYRWGNTVDPITPGLTDRPFVARELIPYGTPPSADLLNAVDLPMQSGRPDPTTWAPLARLMGVGDIVFRADLEYERYLTPRPRVTWSQLLAAPGLADPVGFGDPVRNEASDELPVDDTRNYAIPLTADDPPPVSIFRVLEPRSILRTVAARSPVVVSGNGAGVVALSTAAMLDPDRLLMYSASFADDEDGLGEFVTNGGASLVITDTNRRSARRWGGVRDNDGYTERSGEVALLEDVNDNRLQLFPSADDSYRTVVDQIGGATLAATRYGNDVTYTAGDRAVNAMDGDNSTAWRVAAFAPAEGHFLDVDLHEPVTTDHFELLQVQGTKNRHMTEISVTLDDGKPIKVALDDTSRTGSGQMIEFPRQTFQHLRVTVEGTDRGRPITYTGISDVGIAELRIPGVEPVHEVVRPPVDMVEKLGDASRDHQLTYLFTRRASNPSDVLAADEEPRLLRRIDSPVARSFTVFGKARVAVTQAGDSTDALLGIPSAAEGGVTATASAHLPGTHTTRARSAIDADPATAWMSPITEPLQALTFEYPRDVTVGDLVLTALTSDKFSVPRTVEVEVDGKSLGSFDVADTGPGDAPLADMTRKLAVGTGPITGRRFTISITSVEERYSKDWFSGGPILLPTGITEVNLPSGPTPSPDAPFDSGCRDDLMQIDGVAVPLRVSGTFGAAATGEALHVEQCGDDVELSRGSTLLETTRGTVSGFDLDLIGMDSTAGGAAGTDPLAAVVDDPDGEHGDVAPSSHRRETGRLSYELEVGPTNKPYWIVLGQSVSDGWTATTEDGVDLGPPTLVNGFANGWFIDPAIHGESVVVQLRWAPQGYVWTGLVLSALGVLICFGLVALPRRRRRHDDDAETPAITPVLIPWRSTGIGRTSGDGAEAAVSEPTWATRTAVSIGYLLVVTFLAGPVVGVIAGVGCAVAMSSYRGRWAVRICSIALLAAAMGLITVVQIVRHYPLDFRWAEHFEITHSWSMAAAFLMLISIAADSFGGGYGNPSTARGIGETSEANDDTGFDAIDDTDTGSGGVD